MATELMENCVSFNETGNYLSLCTKDGKLKVWDASTGTLKQEYTKNLHLSSPCSTLLWLQISKPKNSKKRRLVNDASFEPHMQDVVAIGSKTGMVMLYSVDTNSILTEASGHSGKVNCLTSRKNNEDLYSCSDDKHIVEWDLANFKMKRKWKAGKESVKSILVLSCGTKLLSASCTIKLWDLDSKEILKTFVGHSTPIFSLLEVPGRESYFISAARGDRTLSAWSTNGKEDNALASFLLEDSAVSVHLGSWSEVTTLCAISERGALHIFEHKLNGVIPKPVKPKLNVSLVSEGEGKKGSSSALTIHAALIQPRHGNILIAYGNSAYLMFETLVLSEHREEHTVLIRKSRRRAAPDEFNSRTIVPDTDGHVEYITNAPSTAYSSQRDVPLQRRLENLALAAPSSDGPKKDNMAQLLLQGLQSRDRDLIHDVLLRQGDSVISSTVRHLPIQALPPLVRELTSLMQGKTFTSKAAVGWLNAVLRIHAGILLSNPELSTMVHPLLSTVDSKVEGLSGLLRLKGRIALVVEQISTANQSDNEDPPEPLLTYQDRDEDSSEAETPPSDESADADVDWDEFSDMDQDDVEPE